MQSGKTGLIAVSPAFWTFQKPNAPEDPGRRNCRDADHLGVSHQQVVPSASKLNGAMQDNSALDHGDAVHTPSRDRLWVYRILGLLSGLAFVFFFAAALLGPVFDSSTKAWALICEIVALGTSLGVGVWRPAQSDAPVMNSRKDAFLAAVLALLLVWCIAGAIGSFPRPPL